MIDDFFRHDDARKQHPARMMRSGNVTLFLRRIVGRFSR